MKAITITNIPETTDYMWQEITGIDTSTVLAADKIPFENLVALSRVQTMKVNSKGDTVPKHTYHLSVKQNDNNQLIVRVDRTGFIRIVTILRTSIVEMKTIDYATIKIEKWFFNTDPNVV